MSSVAATERRAALAVEMHEAGKTYQQIADALGLTSRGLVNYYLHLEARRRKARDRYVESIEERRAYQKAYREGKRDEFSMYGDRTAFKPESRRQSAMWAKLLAEART